MRVRAGNRVKFAWLATNFARCVFLNLSYHFHSGKLQAPETINPSPQEAARQAAGCTERSQKLQSG